MTKKEAAKVLDDMSEYFLVQGRSLYKSGYKDDAKMEFNKFEALGFAIKAMQDQANEREDNEREDKKQMLYHIAPIGTKSGDKLAATFFLDEGEDDLVLYIANVIRMARENDYT